MLEIYDKTSQQVPIKAGLEKWRIWNMVASIKLRI